MEVGVTTSSMPCMVVVVLLTMNRLAMVFMVDRLVVETPLSSSLFLAP